MSTWGDPIRSWAPKSTPGHEKTKDARRKTMQNAALGIPNGAIWCKLWPKTIFEPNYYKVRLIFGSLLGSQISQIGAKWLPRRPPRKSLRKDAEKGSHLTPLTCLNCMRGLKNHDPEALGKRCQKAFKGTPFRRCLGSHVIPDVQKQ